MKGSTIIMFGFVLIFSVSSILVHADFPRISAECREKSNLRDEQYSKLVMKDIITSFNLDLEDNGFIEVTDRDLDAANLIYGGNVNDGHYQSLNQHFNVASRGLPKLYVRPMESYFLYKTFDHTNVMIHLKLKGSQWEVIEQKKKKGNDIKYTLLKCEKEYLKKKKKYYLK
ncbi:hypothetical protein HPT25_22015 [Bacillus sp. BRMEA1]|uniref:hypothetical protein n=1 Tax=Neobacillus endophyticus TaxID=2738405 RepID=UPI001566A4FD|nr:hypothetical protein [Neobacillus endophyticus]NRD80016.1 hypothetical protein [Neobacillus endophyticus]